MSIPTLKRTTCLYEPQLVSLLEKSRSQVLCENALDQAKAIEEASEEAAQLLQKTSEKIALLVNTSKKISSQAKHLTALLNNEQVLPPKPIVTLEITEPKPKPARRIPKKPTVTLEFY